MGKVSDAELASTIDELAKRKATGDVFSTEVVVALPIDWRKAVRRMFNLSLRSRGAWFPDKWRESKIVPVPKVDGPGPLRAEEFRPISLVSGVYKVLTKILASRWMRLWVKGHIRIPDAQFGFLKARSTDDPLTILTALFETARATGHHKYVAALDIASAFDSVEVWNLSRALCRLGFDQGFVQWVRAAYTGLSATVLTTHGESAPFRLTRGVRQGDPLSPLLFLCCMAPLGRLMEDRHPRSPHDNHIPYVGYADDTTLVGRTVEELEAMVAETREWCRRTGMRLNTRKTVLFATTKPRVPLTARIGEPVEAPRPFSPTVKILGVVFDTLGTWAEQGRVLRRRAVKLAGVVGRKRLSIEMMERVMRALLLPKVMYPLVFASPAALGDIEAPLFRAFRQAARLSWWSTPAVRVLTTSPGLEHLKLHRMLDSVLTHLNRKPLGMKVGLAGEWLEMAMAAKERQLGMAVGTLYDVTVPLPDARPRDNDRTLWLARALRREGLSLVHGEGLRRVRRAGALGTTRVVAGDLPALGTLVAGVATRPAEHLETALRLDPEWWRTCLVVEGTAIPEWTVEETGEGGFRVYTDGSTLGREGETSWGWGLRVEFPNGSGRLLCGRLSGTGHTNNIAELLAALVGLRVVPPDAPVRVYTDSAVVMSVVEKMGGERWATATPRQRTKVASVPLAFAIRRAMRARRGATTFRKVKAHTRELDPDSIGNEFADFAARLAAREVPDARVQSVEHWVFRALDAYVAGPRALVLGTVKDRLREVFEAGAWAELSCGYKLQGALARRLEASWEAGGVVSVQAWRRWFLGLVPRLRRFLGKLVTGTLPTRHWWHARVDASAPAACLLCEGAAETVGHLFRAHAPPGGRGWRAASGLSGRAIRRLRRSWGEVMENVDRELEDDDEAGWSEATRREVNLDRWGPVHGALNVWPPYATREGLGVDPAVVSGRLAEELWLIWCHRVKQARR